MEENPLFTVRTILDKSDYRKFLYIDYLRKRFLQVFLGLYTVCVLFLIFTNLKWIMISLSLFGLIETFRTFGKLFFYIFILFVIPLTFEYKVHKVFKTDKTGLFSSYQVFTFYENCIIATLEKCESTRKIKYDQVYRVIETKEYIIFYNNAFSANIIRKKDINDENQDEIIELLKRKVTSNFKKLKRL